MDPKIEVPSAAEASEVEVPSAAEVLEVGGPSNAEGPEVDSIFRAPAHIKYRRESDFEPKLVSIGPYHHGRPKLQPMEETKGWCMLNLLMMRQGDEDKGEDKDKGDGINMDLVPVDPFMKFESRARSFYKEKFDQISVVKFVRMLLLDSFFVIRILLTLYGVIPENIGSLEVNIKDVRSDLLLLENQIPLFFIHELYYWLFPNGHQSINLKDVLMRITILDLPWIFCFNCLNFESDHLLDFYWKSSVPKTEQLSQITKNHKQHANNWVYNPSPLPNLIANATKLHKIAGIKFKRDYDQGLQVEFSKGIMQMGCLKIDSTLATMLVNLIAFENCIPPSLRIISTYIKLLDDLIHSENDVKLLHQFGVIHNTLSSHTKAVTFFNDIGNLCVIDNYDNPFSNLFTDVTKFYESSWNRWATLQKNYYNSPSAGKLVLAIAGLALLLYLVAVRN